MKNFFSFPKFAVQHSAFTLSEVLVTLAIVGVVSAMTVPTLMKNYQRQSYVTQLHKVCNEIMQALDSLKNDKSALNIKEARFYDTEANVSSFFKKYFKITKDCGKDFTPCFSDEYKSINGTDITLTDIGISKVVNLASGASVAMGGLAAVNSVGGYICVDINGTKGPNIGGRDLFYITYDINGNLEDTTAFIIAKLQEVSDPTKVDLKKIRESAFSVNCASNGLGCFGKILNDNWQMNY